MGDLATTNREPLKPRHQFDAYGFCLIHWKWCKPKEARG